MLPIPRSNDKMIAGVAAGLAERFNIDTSLVRLGLVLFTLLGGSGILIYIVLWVLMPRPGGGTIAEEGVNRAKDWYDEQNQHNQQGPNGPQNPHDPQDPNNPYGR